MHTSPVWPAPRSLPTGSVILRRTVGTGGPTDVGRSMASWPEITVATDEVSVRPYAFAVDVTFGKVSRTIRWSSSAEGEPPKATLRTDEVS
jgi:hypothetical protein